MRFEIPFDEKLSRKHADFIFDLHWKGYLKKTNKLRFHIIANALLGILIVYGNNNIGFILIALAIHFLINWLNCRFHYNKSKKIYYKAVEDHINSYVISNAISVWEFLDDHFFYSDFKFDLKIKWNVIKELKVMDQTLFFTVKDSIVANFILEKEEVEDEDFEKIKNFIEAKIKKDGIL